MLLKLLVLNCLLICVLCDDLIIPELPKVSLPKIVEGAEDASSKKLKLAGQKHILAGAGAAGIEKKERNAEKVSNYEKDKGFFFMKAYGWDREKKNEHLNAEGKLLKAGKAGKLFKAGGEFSKKLSEHNNNDEHSGYNGNNGATHGAYHYGYNSDRDDYHQRPSYDQHTDFSRRIGYAQPSYDPNNSRYKGSTSSQEYHAPPEVEYSQSSYEMIQPKTNYYPNKEYTRIHYPTSGTYLPEMNYKSAYDTYKNSKKYPTKKLWNQGYYSNRYYSKPISDNHIENNLVEYYGNEKASKYQPMHINHESYPMNYQSHSDKYSNDHSDKYPSDRYSDDRFDGEDEGLHYYGDKKMSGIDVDNLRSTYSKYNDDYAGSQLLPSKVQLDSTSSSINEQPLVKKQYRLWEGSHYY